MSPRCLRGASDFRDASEMHACWKDGPSILRPPTWAWASTQQAPTLHGPWMAPRRVRVGAWRSRTALAHRLLAPLDLWSPCASLLTLDCTVHGLVLYHMALSCARLVLFQKPNPKELDIFTTQFLSTAHSICDVWCRISRVYRISSQRSTRCRSTSLRYYTFNSLQVTQLYYPTRDRARGGGGAVRRHALMRHVARRQRDTRIRPHV